jgi:hypothetical protein
VKIFEGEVLNLLANRAVAWLDQARAILSQPDIIKAINSIDAMIVKDNNNSEDHSLTPVKINSLTKSSTNGSPLEMEKAHSENGNSNGNSLPRKSLAPKIKLAPGTLSKLEEILVDGDLMEVTFDESAKLWRIFEAAKPIRVDIPDLNVNVIASTLFIYVVCIGCIF